MTASVQASLWHRCGWDGSGKLPAKTQGSGITQVIAIPRVLHSLIWLPASSCLSSPNTSFGGYISRKALVKKEEKKKADALSETAAHHPLPCRVSSCCGTKS